MDHLLSYLLFFPLLIAALMLFMPKAKEAVFRRMALGATGVQLALSIILLLQFDQSVGEVTSWQGVFQFIERASWIDLDLGSLGSLKAEYFLGVDGISLPLVVLSTFILFIGVLSSWNIKEKVRGYFILYLILSSSIIGCFIALDFFLFYIFFELMLLPIFFLIGIWGGKRRSYASIKFFLYTLLGSLFVLIVMIGLYLSVVDGETHTFSLISMMDGEYLKGAILDPDSKQVVFGYSARALAFVFLLIGFGIKLPAVPVHTWLPDAHVEAPTPISVVLAGLLLKVGAYGLFRMAYGIFPDVAADMAPLVAFFGVLSIIYGGMNALAQNDLKRMVAYSSVSHMGFVLIGLASMTTEGNNGALFHLVSHGLISPALFIVAGVIYDRTQNKEIEHFSGLASKMPVYTFFVALFFFYRVRTSGTIWFCGRSVGFNRRIQSLTFIRLDWCDSRLGDCDFSSVFLMDHPADVFWNVFRPSESMGT
ncbi:MAG: NADH-quinone oxidoreductase subunit M [Bacteroidota bacterium]